MVVQKPNKWYRTNEGFALIYLRVLVTEASNLLAWTCTLLWRSCHVWVMGEELVISSHFWRKHRHEDVGFVRLGVDQWQSLPCEHWHLDNTALLHSMIALCMVGPALGGCDPVFVAQGSFNKEKSCCSIFVVKVKLAALKGKAEMQKRWHGTSIHHLPGHSSVQLEKACFVWLCCASLLKLESGMACSCKGFRLSSSPCSWMNDSVSCLLGYYKGSNTSKCLHHPTASRECRLEPPLLALSWYCSFLRLNWKGLACLELLVNCFRSKGLVA